MLSLLLIGLAVARADFDAGPFLPLCAASATTPSLVPTGSFDGYQSLDEIASGLAALAAAHPADVRPAAAIGTSVEGRPILATCLGACPGVGDSAAGSPSLLLVGLHHAREPLGMLATLRFAEMVLGASSAGDPSARALLARRAIHLLPCVNPDGYAYNLQPAVFATRLSTDTARKNRRGGECSSDGIDRGVDLNRNYDFSFSLDDLGSSPRACNEDYRGASAFSEVESSAVRDHFGAMGNVSIALNWHSFGQMVNLPWAVKALGSPPAPIYDVFLSLARGYRAATGGVFTYGHPGDNGLYSVNGEASDWMLQAHGTFAMSPELGPEFDRNFFAGMWPRVEEQPALLRDALAIAEYSAWASGPLVRASSAAVSVSPCAVASAEGGCAVVAAAVAVRNEGVRDAVGDVVVALVDASAALGGGAVTWAGVGVPSCSLRRDLDGTPLACARAPEVRDNLVATAPTGAPILTARRSLRRTRRLIEARDALLETLRAEAVATATSAPRVGGPVRVASDGRVRIDMHELERLLPPGGVDNGDDEEGDTEWALESRPPLRRAADEAASAAWVGPLPPLNESQRISLSVRVTWSLSAAADVCAAAETARLGACSELGGADSHPAAIAYLGVSDAQLCTIYAVSCTGAVRAVFTGQSGCAPCLFFRSRDDSLLFPEGVATTPSPTPSGGVASAGSSALPSPAVDAVPAGSGEDASTAAGSSSPLPANSYAPDPSLDILPAAALPWPWAEPDSVSPSVQLAAFVTTLVAVFAVVFAVGSRLVVSTASRGGLRLRGLQT